MRSSSNSHDFLPATADIAREAGALLMDYFRQNVKVEYKGEADLVTVADRKSEALIRERLRQTLAYARHTRRRRWAPGHGQRLPLVR